MTNFKNILHIIGMLALTGFAASTRAQEVSIPDPGLNAAIRAALQKPSGPLTEQDLLTLTNLDASRRNVSSIAGLEAARNLVSLDLQINHLSNVSPLGALTNLSALDLSVNPLTDFFLPGGLTNLTSLTIESAGLTNLTLPAGMTLLNDLDLFGNQLTGFNALSNLTSLTFLDLGFNSFTNFSLLSGLTNLTTFFMKGNPLTNITLPGDMMALTNLHLDQNQLTRFTLPAGLTNLSVLNLFFNQLTNLSLPGDAQNLTELNLDFNRFTSFSPPTNLTHLSRLHLRANLLTNFNLPAALTALTFLDLSTNQLTSVTLPAGHPQLSILALSKNKFTAFTLPPGLTNLTALTLAGNQLTNVVFPPDLGRLVLLDLGGNLLTSFTVPTGLTNLFGLFLTGNQLTNITLPPDLIQFGALGYIGNPLTTLVLPEFLAATTLAAELTEICNRGVSVFTYPLVAKLVQPLALVGSFKFGITGPPGVYSVLASTNLATWSVMGVASNPLGSVTFHDVTSSASPQKFYRVLLQVPPANMVFIPPGTFVMGSPEGERERRGDEFQHTVTLTQGFWMGRHEVSQEEYFGVMGSNPSYWRNGQSAFGSGGVVTNDLRHPVELVSWNDATNYCARLTARERAAGRIPANYRYRLPTEAEWEYACRGGTTNAFHYGKALRGTMANLDERFEYDADVGTISTSNYFGRTSVVGSYLPNGFGLYDMHGNVWEWSADRYGPYPLGAVSDPRGPVSGSNRVFRGGSWFNLGNHCRSAFRYWFEPGYRFTDLGLRVVLAPSPQ